MLPSPAEPRRQVRNRRWSGRDEWDDKEHAQAYMSMSIYLLAAVAVGNSANRSILLSSMSGRVPYRHSAEPNKCHWFSSDLLSVINIAVYIRMDVHMSFNCTHTWYLCVFSLFAICKARHRSDSPLCSIESLCNTWSANAGRDDVKCHVRARATLGCLSGTCSSSV